MVIWVIPALVSVALQPLFQELLRYGRVTYEQYVELKPKLEHMISTFSDVRSLIHEASENLLADVRWQGLLHSYDNVEYDVHDLMDEFGSDFSKLDFWNEWFKNLPARVSKIQSELDEIRGKINSHSLHIDIVSRQLDTVSLGAPVIGRESDKLNIIQRFNSLEDNVSVIPIVGTIGVGKTTLAHLLYVHDAYKVPFDMKIWVPVPEEFDVTSITRSVIEKAISQDNAIIPTSDISHPSDLCSLLAKLGEVVEKKKFMLVLDDLWSVDPAEWSLLFTPLKRGLKGSVVIVTTGSKKVLLLEGMSKPHDLKCLSDEDCWSLLKEQTLLRCSLETVLKFEAFGKEIARKCKGLPLAVMIVGRLLRQFNGNVNEWRNFQEGSIWDSPLLKEHIVLALNRGYRRLPFSVRQCFAYCSMFPQSYKFDKDKLIRMWMGEGFIVANEPHMLEDTGRDYINQLFGNSFFQMDKNMYIIEGAVHELVQSASSEKFLRLEKSDDSRIRTNIRHLSLVQRITSETPSICKRLRTFLMSREYDPPLEQVPLSLFEVGSLRVLDLSGTRLKQLKVSLGKLKHLYFLDLSNTILELLPETIKELCLLHTLRLVNCKELLCLPRNIGKLKSLRHIELGGNIALRAMPSGTGNLTDLQTVNEFIIGYQRGQIKELKGMNSIQGSLCIKKLENVKFPQESLEANLAEKKDLDSLELQWNKITNPDDVERVLYNIMNYANDGITGSSSTGQIPSKRLKELTLKGYGGRSFPTWLSHRLSELTHICFYRCEKCLILPPLGNLPKLKILEIIGMHDLKMVDKSFLGNSSFPFPSLETLEFSDMRQLTSWVDLDVCTMASLHKLTVKKCPQMNILPSLHYLQSLVTLTIEECPNLQVFSVGSLPRTVQSLIITGCPTLEERCKINGADWAKIRDIPRKAIGRVTTT